MDDLGGPVRYVGCESVERLGAYLHDVEFDLDHVRIDGQVVLPLRLAANQLARLVGGSRWRAYVEIPVVAASLTIESVHEVSVLDGGTGGPTWIDGIECSDRRLVVVAGMDMAVDCTLSSAVPVVTLDLGTEVDAERRAPIVLHSKTGYVERFRSLFSGPPPP